MSLTQTAANARKIVKFSVIGIVAFFAFRASLNAGIAIWKKLNPPPEPPPTVAFGKLPKIEFPLKEQPENLEFILETPTRELPTLPDRSTVYFIPYKRPNLLALEKAKEIANKIGFDYEPQALTEKLFRWTKKDIVTTTLEMDIVSGTFVYSYDWQSDPTILLEKELPGEQQAKTEVQSFLRKIGSLSDDILTGIIEVSYLKIRENKFSTAMSLSEADFVKVEIIGKNIDDLATLTPDPDKGIISFIFSGAPSQQRRIIRVEFNYLPVNYDSSATYPLMPVSTYWKQLQEGEAFLANWKEENSKIIIRRIYLAHYDSFEGQNFLQPIIVFEGDNNFIAYLSAISPEWLQ